MDTNTSHQKDVLTTGDAVSDTLHKVLDSGPVVNSFEIPGMDTNTSHQKDVLTTKDAVSDTLHKVLDSDGSNDNIQEDAASDTLHKVLDSGLVDH